MKVQRLPPWRERLGKTGHSVAKLCLHEGQLERGIQERGTEIGGKLLLECGRLRGVQACNQVTEEPVDPRRQVRLLLGQEPAEDHARPQMLCQDGGPGDIRQMLQPHERHMDRHIDPKLVTSDIQGPVDRRDIAGLGGCGLHEPCKLILHEGCVDGEARAVPEKQPHNDVQEVEGKVGPRCNLDPVGDCRGRGPGGDRETLVSQGLAEGNKAKFGHRGGPAVRFHGEEQIPRHRHRAAIDDAGARVDLPELVPGGETQRTQFGRRRIGDPDPLAVDKNEPPHDQRQDNHDAKPDQVWHPERAAGEPAHRDPDELQRHEDGSDHQSDLDGSLCVHCRFRIVTVPS